MITNKKILVTGATGIIGYNLAELLLWYGNEVHINYLSDLEPQYHQLDKRFVHHQFDICDLERIACLPDFDIIFHLSGYGQPKKFIENPGKTFDLNTKSLHALTSITKEHFVFMSSSELYANSLSTHEMSDIVLTPNNPRNCYILGKLCGEQYLKGCDIMTTSFRICLCYGRGFRRSDTRVINELIKQAVDTGEIRLMDDGSARRQYIHVEDAIRMMMDCIERGKHSIYNIGGKEEVTIAGLATRIAMATGISSVISGPPQGRLVGSPGYAGVDISRYEEQFGERKFTPLSYGVHDAINWYRSMK